MYTTDRVKVKVDLNRVANNLRTSDGQSVGEALAKAFMRYLGFSLDADGRWCGPRAGLGKFNPGEVIGVEPA